MKEIAIKIDIEMELAAINAGQCGSCRLGLTHQPTKACYNYKEHYAKMTYCPICNHLYATKQFNKCPVCGLEETTAKHPITSDVFTVWK